MNSKKDYIFLEDLEVRCIIGIFDWERKIRQKILISLEIPANVRRAASKDRIEDAINYKAIAKKILKDVPKTRFNLVESLAEYVADICLKEFKLRKVTVRISKPGAVRNSKNVGIQITRKQGTGS